MLNAITTTGLTGGSVSTPHQSGQSTREWIDAHTAAVDQGTPKNDTLTTTWTSLAGPEQVVTIREPGESDALFLARHEAAYCAEMVTAPPVP